MKIIKNKKNNIFILELDGNDLSDLLDNYLKDIEEIENTDEYKKNEDL